jgi:hypothetical protein
MEVKVTPKYMIYIFALCIAPVICSVWGGPVWATISFIAFLAIYAGHEWMHVYVCKINNLHVETVNLSTGGETEILFEPATGDNKDRIEADVYLAGVAWDAVFYAISVLSSLFYAILYHDITPFIFGSSLILIFIFLLAMPGSDWQEFRKRTTMRA